MSIIVVFLMIGQSQMRDKIQKYTMLQNPVRKICIVCSKGTLENVLTALNLANGAALEGIEAKLFFTNFGIDAITKKSNRLMELQAATLGTPSLRLPNGWRVPTRKGSIPGMETIVSRRIQKQMNNLNIPSVSQYFEIITAGGGEIYACKLAMDMFKLNRDDLSEHVKAVVTVGEFYELAAGVGTQIIFT